MELEDLVLKHSNKLDSISDQLLDISKTMVVLMERERNMSSKEYEISQKIDKLGDTLNDQSAILNKVESRISQLEQRTPFMKKLAGTANYYWKLSLLVIIISTAAYQVAKYDFMGDFGITQINKNIESHKHDEQEIIKIEP